MRVRIRLLHASGKICKAILLGLMTIALVIPRGDVALGQSSTGSSSPFTTFDIQGSSSTWAYGINDAGLIVGYSQCNYPYSDLWLSQERRRDIHHDRLPWRHGC